MANAPKKEELLVENAILKYNEQVRKMLKEELAPFSEEISKLNKRMERAEIDINEIKDTIQPFSVLRKRIWFVIIFASILVGIAGNQFVSLLNKITK
jgi:hypothetical protein